jgi:predicted 3-demethylubiquinone-9 3-methyltransferase (glyoxalase superfamily)
MVSAESASQVLVPSLWLDDTAEAAAAFYVKLLPSGRVLRTTHYPESFDNPGQKPRGSVLTVEFEVASQRFTALNGGPQFKPNPSLSFILHVESMEQAERVLSVLGKPGGDGFVTDRHGVSWKVLTGQREPGGAVIVPCFRFSGPVRGRATEAMEFYTRVFPESRVVNAPYGRFNLAGHELVAEDSSLGVTFDEGLSLQVMCKSQAEIDAYWDALSAGGSTGPCGWLKDRFGFSWQVVPMEMDRWLAAEDRFARERVFEAMLKMKKLDLAALERAFSPS